MQLNEAFRTALQTALQAHRDALSYLEAAGISVGDDSDESNYCKAIAILMADNIGQMSILHQQFYSFPPKFQEQLFEQCTYRVSAFEFIAKKSQNTGDKISSLADKVFYASQCVTHAGVILKQNPEDFTAFEKAERAIQSIKTLKKDPHGNA